MWSKNPLSGTHALASAYGREAKSYSRPPLYPKYPQGNMHCTKHQQQWTFLTNTIHHLASTSHYIHHHCVILILQPMYRYACSDDCLNQLSSLLSLPKPAAGQPSLKRITHAVEQQVIPPCNTRTLRLQAAYPYFTQMHPVMHAAGKVHGTLDAGSGCCDAANSTSTATMKPGLSLWHLF